MQKKTNLKNKIFNQMMLNGNKHTCEKIIFKNIKKFQKTITKNHLMIIKLSILNISPTIQLRQIKKKKRKSLKEFAYVLSKKNRISLGIKYIIEKVNKTTSTQTLFQELIAIANKKKESLTTKETRQKMALSKKKYIFFRWFY